MANEHDLPLPRLEAGDVAFETPGTAAGLPDGPVPPKTAADLEQVFDIPVTVSAVLGNAHMPVGAVMKLAPGAVLELDRRGLVARGEVVLVEDKLGVTMTEIIKADR